MKLNQDETINILETIKKEINTVKTTLIEVILFQDIPMQSWHHYDTVTIEYDTESEEVFFSFYTSTKRTSGFATKFEAIKLYRLLDFPELPTLGKHFHILVSDKTVEIKANNESNSFSIIKDYPVSPIGYNQIK